MAPKNKIDYSKAFAKKKFLFSPFLPKTAVPLASAKLNANEDLLILDRTGSRYAFLLKQMSYHHLAQGEIAGQHYLISF